MDKKVNGKWFYACLLMLLFASGLQAQQAQIFKQHDMHRWGIPAGNYSGIAHIGNDRYALISDKQQADGWTEVSIAFLPSGDIASMQFIAHHYDANTVGHARDSEGIAYVPGYGFFVSAENDQQILELSSEGAPTGRRLQIPTCFAPSQIFPNRGFEALAYDAGQGIFWTTTDIRSAPMPSSLPRHSRHSPRCCVSSRSVPTSVPSGSLPTGQSSPPRAAPSVTLPSVFPNSSSSTTPPCSFWSANFPFPSVGSAPNARYASSASIPMPNWP